MVTELDHKGLDPERKINLGMVKKEDTFADAILYKVPQVVLYHYDVDTSTWERGSVEGAFFLYSRSQQPWYAVFILNRLSSTNYCQLLTAQLEFLVKDRFLLFKEAGGAIHGVCFVDKVTAKATGKEVQSVLKDEKVTSSDTSTPAHTQHRPPAAPEGKPLQSTQSPVKPYNNGTRPPAQSSVSAAAVSNQVTRPHSTGRSRTHKGSVRQVGGTASGVEGCAGPKPPTQRGMLSLEEVEKTLYTRPSGGTVEAAAPPTQPLPCTSQSKAAAEILSMISPPRHHPPPPVATPPRHHPPPPVATPPCHHPPPPAATPPSPALPSPVIGTSEDFPENPPLMVSAGMKSGRVQYTPSKSPPLSNHHSNQTHNTGHHSDSELIGQGNVDLRRERVPTGDQSLTSSVSKLMSPKAFVTPKSAPGPVDGRRHSGTEHPHPEQCALSKQQMLDALKYLLLNDEGFVDKLHDAYRESLAANQQ